MLRGAESALFATVITIGNRMPAALKSTSCIRARPCEVVAVYVRAPVALAPRHTDIAECSDSTFTYCASRSPSAIN